MEVLFVPQVWPKGLSGFRREKSIYAVAARASFQRLNIRTAADSNAGIAQRFPLRDVRNSVAVFRGCAGAESQMLRGTALLPSMQFLRSGRTVCMRSAGDGSHREQDC